MLSIICRHIVPAAYSFLPEAWNTPAATAELLAIGLHESMGFTQRRQVPRKPGYAAPARSFWQFEVPGIRQALTHPASEEAMIELLLGLHYKVGPPISAANVLAATEHNDILAFGLARGLLRTLPRALPGEHDADEGYRQYLDAWKPNKDAAKAHEDDWPRNYALAWDTVHAHHAKKATA